MKTLSEAYAEIAASLIQNAELDWSFAEGRTALLKTAFFDHRRDRHTISKLLSQVGIGFRSHSGTLPVYRGSSPDRLPLIEREGIDVQPTDAMIFGSYDPGKCLEYGPVLLVFDGAALRRSWRHLAANSPAEEIVNAETEFGSNFLLGGDGSRWYTRGQLDDPMVSRPGELEYGYYLPGDPWKALWAVWQFGDCDGERRGAGGS